MALESYDSFVERARLKADSLPNRGIAFDTSALQTSLPEAVAAMRSHMVLRRRVFASDMQIRLAGTLAELKVLQGKQEQQLELRLENLLEGVRRSASCAASRFARFSTNTASGWRTTMTTEPQPYIRVLAALTR